MFFACMIKLFELSDSAAQLHGGHKKGGQNGDYVLNKKMLHHKNQTICLFKRPKPERMKAIILRDAQLQFFLPSGSRQDKTKYYFGL